MTNRNLFRCFIALISLTAAAVIAQSHSDEIETNLITHVKYLSSDELEGRMIGGEGNWLAAKYIADHFASHGLKPLGESFFQEFPVITKVDLGENNRITIQKNSQTTYWTVGEQYIPLGFSENASVSGDLVFAGYGITLDAEDNKYDDYGSIDASGKIVLVLRGSPEEDNPHSAFAAAEGLRHKATNAREHGASAIIFIDAEEDSAQKLLTLKPDRSTNKAGIVALHALHSAVQQLLPDGRNLNEIAAQIQETTEPLSFAINDVAVNVSVDLNNIEKPTANVIGYVPGRNPDLADEYIVVGAHFDHLGWGGENSRYEGNEPAIHHGADDNASGTAAMMELARIVAENPLDRSAIFMGFTGEEFGLLGSAYYTQNPLAPLEQTVFMLNLDMVGRMEENKLNIHGTGTSTRWDTLVDSLQLVHNVETSSSSDGWGPSDQTSFYAKDIPVLFLFTGLHDDYHKPSDTWEKLNYKGLTKVVKFSESIIRSVGGKEEKPDFVQTSSPGARRSMAFRVYVGTIPDYSDNPKGLRLSGIRSGSPAEKAGMQGGDIMIKFGEIDIKTIYDYTYALGKYKPGETVEVVVLRGEDDQKETLQVTLEKR